MYTKLYLILFSSLLLFTACVLGAGEVLDFPTYCAGEASFPKAITVTPVFSGNGNYGLVASGDTLYHMELRHCRIHGKTPIGGEITSLDAGSGSSIFVLSGDHLLLLNGFSIAASCDLPGVGIALTVCGDDPVVLMDDGSLHLFKGTDLTHISSHIPVTTGIVYIQGFSGMVVAGYEDGAMITLSTPSFAEKAVSKFNGSLLFMTRAGQSSLIFSTDEWNEVAVCSPEDLKLQQMFTFSETPVSAASDGELSCVFAVLPSMHLQVCLASGELAWKTDQFDGNSLVVVAEDCEVALVSSENTVTLLLK